MKVAKVTPDATVGGFPWLDRHAHLREWFAKWLRSHWQRIYADSLRDARAKGEVHAYGSMKSAVEKLATQLPDRTTAVQLALLDTAARRLKLATTYRRIEDELSYYLKRKGGIPENKAAFKASPWWNHSVLKANKLRKRGEDLLSRFYPGDADSRLALNKVISGLSSPATCLRLSPDLARLTAADKGLDQFIQSICEMPADSPLQPGLKKIEPAALEFQKDLRTELRRLNQLPGAFTLPSHPRRLQRALVAGIRRICRHEEGAGRLVTLILKLLRDWPRIPAGVPFDLETHFDEEVLAEMIHQHLHARAGRVKSKESLASRGTTARPLHQAFAEVLNAAIFQKELRLALLALAEKAKQVPKGWSHLRKVLKAVFRHIGRKASKEEMFREFELANYTWMRNLTPQQRMDLLPELGHDSDPSVRELSRSERMTVYQRLVEDLPRDADNKNAFATGYGRSMQAIRRELEQD